MKKSGNHQLKWILITLFLASIAMYVMVRSFRSGYREATVNRARMEPAHRATKQE